MAMMLGQLIDKLEMMPPDATCQYDVFHFVPSPLDSWRGIYNELALGWRPPNARDHRLDTTTVAELLADAKAAVGKTFDGYKGGEYVMSRDTPVHIDNYGETYSNLELADVNHRKSYSDHPGWCMLVTEKRNTDY